MNPYAVRYGLGRAWGGAALTFGMWLVSGAKVFFAVGATLWVMSSAWMVLWVLVHAGSAPLVGMV